MTEERAFLTAILEHPDDDTTRLVYADWLEEQDDPRAEFLRLMVKVREGRIVSPEQRKRHQELSTELAEIRTQVMEEWRSGNGESPENQARQQRLGELESQLRTLSQQIKQQIPARLQELAATLDPNWLVVVGDPEIEGCGKCTGDFWRPHFEFICEKTWAGLSSTGDSNVRHCESCNKNVHFCDNLADARDHSQQGHCIAVDLGVIRREGDLHPPAVWVGQPSPEMTRESYKHDIDPVSEARLAARKLSKKKRPRR
jgi:uncharacterized protein (TIGR02996 family)